MTGGKKGDINYNRLKNLLPYKNLTDEEYQQVFTDKFTGVALDKMFEKRINDKLDDFGKDYDLTDLKTNDLLVLRHLIQALIFLEDLERASYMIRTGGLVSEDGIQFDKINKLDSLNAIMTTTRKDIIALQDNLNISRKTRKSDKETSVITAIDNLKKAADEFYEQRMFYVWCPKCKMLLFTGWFLYPEEPRNKVRLVCNRTLDGGEVCGQTILVGSKELLESRGVNIKEVPEFFK